MSAHKFIGLLLAVASFGSQAAVITDRVDVIFVQCAGCSPAVNNDSTLGYIKTALSAYAAAASTNGWGAAAIGDEIQIEKYTQTAGGYVLGDHFYTIKNLPVQSFSDLNDEGFSRDADSRALPNRAAAEAAMRGDVVSFVESFADSGKVTTIDAFFPQN